MTDSELVFEMSFNQLPVSVNKYLAPSIAFRGNKAYPYMRETTEAKRFKEHFGNALKRKVRDIDWDKEVTREGHWYLDCQFVQKRVDEDSNNYLKILIDSLVDIVCIDDNNILPRVERVMYSSKYPSFSIKLYRTDYVGLFKNKEDRQDFIDSQCAECKFYRNGACSVLKSIDSSKLVDEYNPRDNICFKFTKKKGK